MDRDSVIALNNRGTAHLRHGRHADAVRCLSEAAAACGPLSACRSNLLLSTLYHPSLDPEQVAEAHKLRMDDLPERAFPRPHRRLRIAYLTPDFHFHPKAFLHIPHLRHYDRTRFELFVYSSANKPDVHTCRAREAADNWRDVADREPAEIAALIRSDGIDILLDITGHFANSPLPVFALRPAPLQISIPGYPATTGLPTVDFKIVDRETDPPGMTESLYSETLLRVNRPVVCYAAPEDAPEIGPLPLLKNGYITFGWFNNRPKLNPPLVSVYARILKTIPEARLLMHHTFNGYRDVSPDFRGPITRLFRANGISSRRLEFVGGVPLVEHLRLLSQADMALDSFPYNGVTTTCECLWMGVPVLTLAGRTHASRTGASILRSLGSDSWIASSAAEYVAQAVARARDGESLCANRMTLREAMRRSEITDGSGYVRALESSFTNAWALVRAGG